MKKFLALFLSMLLIFSTITFVSANETPTIEVSSADATPGEQVTLTVSVNGNPGFNTFTLGFDYDTDRLQLDSVALSNGIPGQLVYAQKATWLNGSDITTNGAYLDLTFTVLEEAELGDAAVTVTYNQGDICNLMEEDINFDIVAGKITVTEETTEDPEDPEIPDTAPKYQIYAEKNAIAGKTVTVYVAIENNPGISSIKNAVSYDESVLTLESVTDLGTLDGYTNPSPIKKSPYTLVWNDKLATENNTESGNIAALTFSVAEGTPAGEYEISVAHKEAWAVVPGAENEYEAVVFEDASSVITVIDVKKGDANADGTIDLRDASDLAKYLADWNVEVIDFACDINEDGEVNDRDSILLDRYLADWDVPEMN